MRFDPTTAESELGPSELGGSLPTPTEEETALVALIDARIDSSHESRREHLDDSLLCHRFYSNKHWLEVKDQRPMDLRASTTPSERKRIYAQANKLRPIARKHISRALSAQVVVSIAPLTPRRHDVEVAAEARALNAHFARAQGDDACLLDCVSRAVVKGCAAVLDYWDPSALVPLPELSPDDPDEIVDVRDERAGDACSRIIEIEEIYPDPKGKNVRECQWLIVASWHSLAWIQASFPDTGRYVESEGSDGAGSPSESRQRLRVITGDRNQSSAMEGATVKFLFEKPSLRFPSGRYVVAANGRVLHNSAWPYTSMVDGRGELEFPVTFLWFEPGMGSFWSAGPLSPLIDLQRQYDRMLSLVGRQTQKGFGKILAPRGCEIDPDAFKSEEPDEVVYYNQTPQMMGAKPEMTVSPPLDPTIPAYKAMLEADLNDIGEVQDVSRGQAPYSGAPAAAIEAMLQADASSSRMFVECIRTFSLARARKRLALAQQFYVQPRLVAVQDAEPEDPQYRAFVFANSNRGRYVVSAVASTPRPPQARVQLLVDLAAQGLLSPDAAPMTIKLLRAQGLIESDKDTENLLREMEEERDAAQERQSQSAVGPEMLRAQSRMAETEAKTAAEQATNEQQAAQEIARQEQSHAMQMERQQDQQDNDLLMAGLQHESQQSARAAEMSLAAKTKKPGGRPDTQKPKTRYQSNE